MALVMAIGIMAVLGTVSTTSIYYSTSNARTSNYSKTKTGTFSLAEAGINNAMAVLSNPTTNSLDPDALCPTGQSAPCSQTSTYANGSVTWSGVLDRAQAVWTLTSTGSTRNTSATSGNVTQKLTAKVSVTPTYTQPLNNPSWNYVMSTQTGNTCDMTLAGGTNTGNQLTVSSRLYVFGNLCLGTSSGGMADITGGPLMVKGKVNINEGSSNIGSSGTPVNEVHVGQGCKYLSNTLHNPCQQGAGGSGKDNLWASVIDSTVPSLTAPVADFAGWYENAIPGPAQSCTTTSGTLPTFDTNYPTRDNSVATPFELTPAGSYECTVGPSASPSGQLKWDVSTKTLTVKGTIFIDGSVKITNGALNQYNGQATLYLSGTFLMNNGSKLCGGISGANCDYASWNPNTELFTIVAGGTGGQVPAGVSAYINGGQFQGAIFGTGKVRLEGATQVDGPLVGSEVELGYNVSSGTSTGYGFPTVTTVPVGMPSNPAVYAQPNPPQMFSG